MNADLKSEGEQRAAGMLRSAVLGTSALTIVVCVLMLGRLAWVKMTPASEAAASTPYVPHHTSLSSAPETLPDSPVETKRPVKSTLSSKQSTTNVAGLNQNPEPTPAAAQVQVLPRTVPVNNHATAAAPVPGQKGARTEIFGRVTLLGNPPAEKPLPLDPMCGSLQAGARPTTTFYVVSADKGLADTFVYITQGLEGQRFDPPALPAVLDQVGCAYVPYVSGAQTGQIIQVKNSDPLLHNVHPTPTVQGNQEKNRAMMKGSPPLEFAFPQPEVFLRFKCDIHNWMFAYVAVVDHPFWAVSGKDGTFSIQNIPPGTYTVQAYHRKAGRLSGQVKVIEDNRTEINFELPVEGATQQAGK